MIVKGQQINDERHVLLPLWEWGAGNVYLLLLSKAKSKHCQHPIAVKAQYIFVDFILIVFKFDTLLIGTLCPGTSYSKAFQGAKCSWNQGVCQPSIKLK